MKTNKNVYISINIFLKNYLNLIFCITQSLGFSYTISIKSVNQYKKKHFTNYAAVAS